MDQKALFIKNRLVYMAMGDLDKPFHKPECSCERCEEWRADKGRPTFKELRDMPKED